jgi:hypothetical protein
MIDYILNSNFEAGRDRQPTPISKLPVSNDNSERQGAAARNVQNRFAFDLKLPAIPAGKNEFQRPTVD